MATSQDWSRVANTTISNFIKGEEVNILRNRKLTALIKARGRISMGWSGDDMVWRVRYRRHGMQGYADNDTISFKKKDRWKTARLGWRGYTATDSIGKMERQKNRGAQAIINVWSDMAKNLMEDVEEAFCDELYIDGNTNANRKKLHGIESFCGAGASNGYVATPNDSFAGLDTNLAGYGGGWTGTWPTGAGDSHYDFWAPLLCDFTGSGWSATTPSWENNCIEVLRFAIIKSNRNKSKRGKLDLFLLNDELFRIFLGRQEEKMRMNVQNTVLSKYGFNDVFNFDGVDLTYEYGTPANTGYGINVDQMEIRSLQNQLFVPDGPIWDQASRNWRFDIDFMGNCVWNPRYQIKLYPYS